MISERLVMTLKPARKLAISLTILAALPVLALLAYGPPVSVVIAFFACFSHGGRAGHSGVVAAWLERGHQWSAVARAYPLRASAVARTRYGGAGSGHTMGTELVVSLASGHDHFPLSVRRWRLPSLGRLAAPLAAECSTITG